MSAMSNAHGARGAHVTSNSDGLDVSQDEAKVTTSGQPIPPQRRVRTQSRPENDPGRNSQVRFDTRTAMMN